MSRQLFGVTNVRGVRFWTKADINLSSLCILISSSKARSLPGLTSSMPSWEVVKRFWLIWVSGRHLGTTRSMRSSRCPAARRFTVACCSNAILNVLLLLLSIASSRSSKIVFLVPLPSISTWNSLVRLSKEGEVYASALALATTCSRPSIALR